ncbi:MAG: hypothetical protein RMY34_02340 [Aulosira sp. DedQUE10]|nr:hypothetical protein [Aulosira sp. DedQUE10]
MKTEASCESSQNLERRLLPIQTSKKCPPKEAKRENHQATEPCYIHTPFATSRRHFLPYGNAYSEQVGKADDSRLKSSQPLAGVPPFKRTGVGNPPTALSPQRSALETFSAVAHGGNPQDLAASPRRWLLKLLTGETQCRN